MSTYAEINRQRRRARTLYLELRALDLSLRAVPEDTLRGYAVEVRGLRSLSPAHADRVRQKVEENAPGLARILDGGRWAPDLRAVYEEGCTHDQGGSS